MVAISGTCSSHIYLVSHSTLHFLNVKYVSCISWVCPLPSEYWSGATRHIYFLDLLNPCTVVEDKVGLTSLDQIFYVEIGCTITLVIIRWGPHQVSGWKNQETMILIIAVQKAPPHLLPSNGMEVDRWHCFSSFPWKLFSWLRFVSNWSSYFFEVWGWIEK